jgi:hypothetical protein
MAHKLTAEVKSQIVLSVLEHQRTHESIIKEYPDVTEDDIQKWIYTFSCGGAKALKRWTPGRVLYVGLVYVCPAVLIVGAILMSIITTIVYYPWDGNWEVAAWAGDFWGGNLASGCTLAGVLLFFLAIMLQGQEIKGQREEIQLSRAEMRQTREVAETQLQLARESSAVMQILECARLQFEAETSRDETTSTAAQASARGHLARLEEVFEVLFSSQPLNPVLRRALFALLDSEYGAGDENQGEEPLA